MDTSIRVLVANRPRLLLWRKRILIPGATSMAGRVMRGSLADPFLGYEVAGLLDSPPRFAPEPSKGMRHTARLKTALQLLADRDARFNPFLWIHPA